MATATQVNNFIKNISVLAQQEAKRRKDKNLNWVLPSICIAQAALETGWGTSTMMTKANAYFGIKAGVTWKGKVYDTMTKECYDKKTFVTIRDTFRAYDTLKDSIADYYKLICDTLNYRKARNNTSAYQTISAIHAAGYATAPNYVTSIMDIVNSYNLTKYDDVVTMPDIEYNVWVKKYKWLGFVRNGESAGKKGYAIRCVKIKNISGIGRMQYRVHDIDTNQWGSWKIGSGAGIWAGSTKHKIDCIQIKLLDNNTYSIEYRSAPHNGEFGDWKNNGAASGTAGKAMGKLQLRVIRKE